MWTEVLAQYNRCTKLPLWRVLPRDDAESFLDCEYDFVVCNYRSTSWYT